MNFADFVVLADYEELGLLLGNVILGGWALVVFIALWFRAFRHWIGLAVALLIALAATLPAAAEYVRISQWPHVAGRSSVVDLWKTTVILLCFVYGAPIIQYGVVRFLAARRLARQATDNGD